MSQLFEKCKRNKIFPIFYNFLKMKGGTALGPDLFIIMNTYFHQTIIIPLKTAPK
jgi:hypothetical protein